MSGGSWSWLAAAVVMAMIVVMLVVGWRCVDGRVSGAGSSLVMATAAPNLRGAVDGVDEDGGRLAARGSVVAVDDVVNAVEALPSGEAEVVDGVVAARRA